MANSFFKKHKYGAKKTFVDGQVFPSALEAAVWLVLREREQAGEIKNLSRYASVRLKDKCSECGSSAVTWKVDFCAEDESGKKIFIEAKGVETPDYKRRKKLWKKRGPGRLEIWKGSHRRPRLAEVIEK